MKIETNMPTTIMGDTVSGDYDTYEGWETTLKDAEGDDKNLQDFIIGSTEIARGEDGIFYEDEDTFAKHCLDACNKRALWQPDNYKDGSLLAYCDTIDLADVCPDHSCNADIRYKVTVAFDKEQEDYTLNDQGDLVPEDLDWEHPYILSVEEIRSVPEAKKPSCSMQKKKESLAKKACESTDPKQIEKYRMDIIKTIGKCKDYEDFLAFKDYCLGNIDAWRFGYGSLIDRDTDPNFRIATEDIFGK